RGFQSLDTAKTLSASSSPTGSSFGGNVQQTSRSFRQVALNDRINATLLKDPEALTQKYPDIPHSNQALENVEGLIPDAADDGEDSGWEDDWDSVMATAEPLPGAGTKEAKHLADGDKVGDEYGWNDDMDEDLLNTPEIIKDGYQQSGSASPASNLKVKEAE